MERFLSFYNKIVYKFFNYQKKSTKLGFIQPTEICTSYLGSAVHQN